MIRSQEVYDTVATKLRVPVLLATLAVIPLLAFSASSRHLSDSTTQAVAAGDWIIWGFFAVEYLVLLALAPSRGQYVKTHLLELLLVALPFLRPLRLVRSVRALRVLRTVRLGVAGTQATRIARRRLVASTTQAVGVMAVLLVFLCSVAVLDLEQDVPGSNIHHLPDALWWAVVTVTTVGYGDHFPITNGGRGVAVVLMLTGISLLGVVTAALASWFVKVQDAAEGDDIAELRADVARLTALVEGIAADVRPGQFTAGTDASTRG